MLDADPTDLPESPAGETATDSLAEAPKKATRRRATKAAAATAPAPEVAPADPGAVPAATTSPVARAPRKRAAKAAAPAAVAAPEAASAPEPPVPVARTPRRRTAKAVAPVSGPTIVDEGPLVIPDVLVLADAVVASADVNDLPAEAATPAAEPPAPRARRRATKATSSPAVTESPDISEMPVAEIMVSDIPPAPSAVAELALSAVEVEPVVSSRAPRRRRAASSAQATIGSTDGPAVDVSPAVTAGPALPSAPAAPAGADRSPEPAVTSPPNPFAVTFLAPAESEPQLPTRTRRRATRASGAFAEIAVAADEASELVLDAEPATDAEDEDALESLLSIEDADTDDDGQADDDTDETEEAQSASSRRRRRGRRGRGGRSAREGASGADDGLDDDDAAADGAPTAGRSADAADQDADDSGDDDSSDAADDDETGDDEAGSSSTRRRRKRRRRGSSSGATGEDDPAETVVHVRESAGSRDSGSRDSGSRESAGREPRTRESGDDEVRGIRGSTRLEAKRQRRRDTRDTGRRRAPILTEAEFLARREAVDRVMALRQRGDRTQIAVLEDGILVEHYVTRASATSYVGNIYLGRVQNVLPSMEAAFVDIGKGRNGVLYAGEVNWDAAGLEGRNRTIQDAMSAGDPVLVQVTKDPIGHKGARLTSQISLPGRFLVYVPNGGMTGISRKLPDTERARLKAILKKIIPDDAGVIIRTAAEGASEQELTQDVERLKSLWESIQVTVAKPKNAPIQVHAEPDLAIRVVRDVFNEDFQQLVVSGDATREDDAWATVSQYVGNVAPELSPRLSTYTGTGDLFHDLRVDEQLAKALDRKVWLPSGGSLVIDRTEAMTVIDVNTGKFTGAGGNLEQTVTRNNIEAAEEIVRQLRLRDIGGMIVVDFIDMVLESNRDLVLRRLTECLGRDRTKHQVAEVTSLGLVQMTRKRVGEGLLEAFSEPCEHCHGRGVILFTEPVEQRGDGSGQDGSGQNGSGQNGSDGAPEGGRSSNRRNRRGRGGSEDSAPEPVPVLPPEGQRKAAASVMALIAGAVALTDAEDVVEAIDALASAGSVDAYSVDPIAEVDSAEDQFVESVPLIEATDGAVELAPVAVPAAVEPPVADVTVQAVFDAGPQALIDAAPESVEEVDPTLPPVSRPRRRRGASRPAGPPVHA